MNPVLRHVLAGSLTLGFLLPSSRIACGQEAAAPEVAAQDPAAVPAGENSGGTIPETSDVEDPAQAKSPLVTKPQTPEEAFRDILLLVDISRIKPARDLLKKFLADNPSDDLLIKLRESHGPGAFLQLANIAELQPESKDLLAKSNAAYARYAGDPARLDLFLKDLVSGDLEQQTIARHQMATAGLSVVPALIRVLGDPKYVASQPRIVEMLVQIGPVAVPPLHAALAAPDMKMRQNVTLTLGLIRDERSIPYLLQFLEQSQSTEESDGAFKAIVRIVGKADIARSQTRNVANRLIDVARQHLQGKLPWRVGNDKLVGTWVWNPELGTVQEVRLTPAAASLHYGLYFAKAALRVAPDRQDIQATYLNLLFAEEAAIAGFDKPVRTGPGSTFDLAASLGADAVSRALSEGLEIQRVDAVLVALQVLAKIGTVEQVRTVAGKHTGLNRALNFPSRRVQFAAAETIVSLDPPSKYPGSDRVVAILGRALTLAEDTAKPALVLDASENRGQAVAGFLNDLTFNPTHRQTGREGFLTAANTQELDLILIDANIARWGLSETLSNLKFDPRTMDVPVIIYGEAVTEKTVRVYMSQFPGVYYIEIPANSDDLRRQVMPILEQRSEPPLNAAERSTKSSRAAELLSYLASGQRRKLYDFTLIQNPVLTSLYNTQLTQFLLPVANALPSIEAQTRIAEVIADSGQSNEARALAARQLTSHIRQYGLLIPKELVGVLRANWAQATDPKLYSELSSVIGALKPNAVLVGQRLRSIGAAPSSAPTPAAVSPAPEVPQPANQN